MLLFLLLSNVVVLLFLLLSNVVLLFLLLCNDAMLLCTVFLVLVPCCFC